MSGLEHRGACARMSKGRSRPTLGVRWRSRVREGGWCARRWQKTMAGGRARTSTRETASASDLTRDYGNAAQSNHRESTWNRAGGDRRRLRVCRTLPLAVTGGCRMTVVAVDRWTRQMRVFESVRVDRRSCHHAQSCRHARRRRRRARFDTQPRSDHHQPPRGVVGGTRRRTRLPHVHHTSFERAAMRHAETRRAAMG